MDNQSLQQIQQIIGYQFTNLQLLRQACTHASVVANRLDSNERLEFLGDAILASVVCQKLFEHFPKYLEGDLTKIKSMVVSRITCAQVAEKMKLHNFLKVGKGMASSRSLTGSLAAGMLEAIIAAIYLDGGQEEAAKFLLKVFGQMIEKADAEQAQGNYKSLLQQYAQDKLNTTPIYELLDEKGPDHNKCFEVEAVVSKRHFSSAWGTNKKDAEQKAAFNALLEIGILKE